MNIDCILRSLIETSLSDKSLFLHEMRQDNKLKSTRSEDTYMCEDTEITCEEHHEMSIIGWV